MKQAESEEVKQVKYVDELLMSNINLIPIDNWGFDDETKEEMRTRKHRIVNSLLSDASKKKLSNAAKHLMAREVGSSFQTVTEVFNWLKHSSKGMRPRKRPLGNIQSTPEESHDIGSKSTKRKRAEKDLINNCDLKRTNIDPLLSLNSDKEFTSVTEDIKLSRNVSKNKGKSKIKEQTGIGSKKKLDPDHVKVDVSMSNDNEKIDLPKLPFITDRPLMMQKLQAKIEQLKSLRLGKKTAEQYEDIRKAKRKLSKMAMRERKKKAKQSHSLEAKKTNDVQVSNVKSEDLGVPNDLMQKSDKVVYSKFDFLVKDEPKKLTKSQKRDKFTGKNFKGLLEKAEKRAERLEKIRKSNPDKAQYIEENILWNRAMNRTEGQKVKDDPVLLKKGAVKKEKVKERRKRKWDQRIDFVKRKQEKMQEKRIFNIQARKDMKKNKKLEKAREKGRIL